jgi:hypothetical protein
MCGFRDEPMSRQVSGVGNRPESKTENTRRSRLDDFVPNGVLHDFSVGLQLQNVHCGIFMGSNGPFGNRDNRGDLFHRTAFRQQLNDFSLASGRFCLYRQLTHLSKSRFRSACSGRGTCPDTTPRIPAPVFAPRLGFGQTLSSVAWNSLRLGKYQSGYPSVSPVVKHLGRFEFEP